MLQSIWDDIKQEYNYGNMIKRIIIVNIAIYVFINLVWVFLNGVYPALYKGIVHFFSISSSPWHLLTHPWALISHMFLHEGFFHILWNMLFLFWFGRIFGDLLGDRRVLPLYILGGLGGAVAYFVTANLGLFSGGSYALGASAAVMSILVAAGVFAPDYNIRLLFIGNVKLKWIVMALVFMNIVGTQGISNAGGAWGHLGGIAVGFLFAYQLQRGNDWTEPLQGWINKIENFFSKLWASRQEKKRPGPRAAYRRGEAVKTGSSRKPKTKTRAGNRSSDSSASVTTHQEKLDAILDKIKERGYDSLTKEEKDFLFRASNE